MKDINNQLKVHVDDTEAYIGSKPTMRHLDSTDDVREGDVMPIGEHDYKILVIFDEYRVLAIEHVLH
jgi:hypothetical protein